MNIIKIVTLISFILINGCAVNKEFTVISSKKDIVKIGYNIEVFESAVIDKEKEDALLINHCTSKKYNDFTLISESKSCTKSFINKNTTRVDAFVYDEVGSPIYIGSYRGIDKNQCNLWLVVKKYKCLLINDKTTNVPRNSLR